MHRAGNLSDKVRQTAGLSMSSEFRTVNRTAIIRYEALIRPYIRRTPVIEIDAADIGLDANKLLLKLELFQHSGSFKARGAFANLLTRKIPATGVVAASGGNHGAGGAPPPPE